MEISVSDGAKLDVSCISLNRLRVSFCRVFSLFIFMIATRFFTFHLSTGFEFCYVLTCLFFSICLSDHLFVSRHLSA